MSMTPPTSDRSLSNPFSTGSGGATFEQLVGASYLVSLLAGHILRGLDWGTTKEVLFQQRWSGCVIDDVVVISSDGTRDRRLALQLKHDLSFIKSDETFARVIADCWLVFTNAMIWHFDPDTDRIGLGIGVYQTKLDTHFRPLLEWASTEQTAAAFFQKVAISRFSSAEKREYITLLRELLTEAKGSDVTDEELWRFLKCLVVLHFDLENANSVSTSLSLLVPSMWQKQGMLCRILKRSSFLGQYVFLPRPRTRLGQESFGYVSDEHVSPTTTWRLAKPAPMLHPQWLPVPV
jgi:hypothetical protein